MLPLSDALTSGAQPEPKCSSGTESGHHGAHAMAVRKTLLKSDTGVCLSRVDEVQGEPLFLC